MVAVPVGEVRGSYMVGNPEMTWYTPLPSKNCSLGSTGMELCPLECSHHLGNGDGGRAQG